MKTTIGWTAAILCIAAIIFVWQYSARQPVEPLRYGGQYYPGEFLLKGKPDLWGDLQVEHILFSSGTENNQALIAGEIDVNVGSDSKTASLFAARDDVVIIATLQRGDRYSTIVPVDSDYQTWHDLKGQTVGTRLGTGAEQVLLRYFDSQPGLAWDDFDWVNVKVEDMASFLEAGKIQSFTAWEPTPAIAEARGVGKVLMSYGDVAIVPVSVHTTVGYAEGHEAELVAFLQAHLRKVELIQSNPEQAAELAAKAASETGVDVPADAFLTIFKRVDFSLEFDNVALMALQDTAGFLHAKGKIDKAPEFRWDGSFLEKARAD